MILLEQAVAAAGAFAIGFAVVLLLWPGIARPKFIAVKVFLGIGIGQGITACMMFVFLLVHGRPDRSYPLYELFVLLVLAFLLARTRGSRPSPTVHAQPGGPIRPARYGWILAVALCLAVAAAFAAAVILMYRAPYGHWDAWAIYNLRARAIYRGGADWRDAFSPLVYWSHPDYPPLLPLAVVRAWIYSGVETTVAPRLIAGLFTAATIGLVPAVIAILRGRSQACIAGVVLLGNVFLIEHASSQYADLPLMFYYTAALTLVVLHHEVAEDDSGGRLVLAGLATGLVAWSKNEGLLFLTVILVAHFAVVFRPGCRREYSKELRRLASGLLPVILIVGYFKLTLAPPGDLVTMAAKQSLLSKLVDPARYLQIATEVAQRILPPNPYGPGFVLALTLWALFARLGAARTRGMALGALTSLMMFLGYLAVYVVTPNALAWHLSTSVDRVLLQLWPMFVFVFFVIVATPEEVFASGAAAGAATGRSSGTDRAGG